MSLFDKENQRKIEDENLQNRIYTQLAREGKFDQLPDTCEFSEFVELEVCDGGTKSQIAKVIGKFKGKFVEKEDISRNGYTFWNYAQLPTPKIDFSQFKEDDVVEFQLKDKTCIGYINCITKSTIELTHIKQEPGEEINKNQIKSITKLKKNG
jgi:hypothetical protein